MKVMKYDCFYDGLNPKNQQMLAHKVDGKHPAGYSNLVLAAQKFERWAEARDPLPPNTTVAGRLNATHSQTSGIFPPRSWRAILLSLLILLQ